MCRYPLLLTSALALVSLLPSSAKANQVDLSVSDVQVPTEILMGETFSINAILHCKGSEAATFRWAAYLTINGAIHGAVPLGEFGPVTITANSQLNINESISLPQTISGRQRIAIVVDIDNQVQERNEYDNTGLAVDYMRIRARQADLRVASVQLNVAESLAGESLLATYRVENIGTVAASFTLAGHISRNPAVTTGDTEVGRTTLELQPGQSSSQSLQLNLPSLLAAGDYYIAIIADPESTVSEIQEANNIGVAASSLNVYSPQLSIRTESLPQGTVFIDYYARVAALGGDGRFQFTISNGRLPTGLIFNATTGVISGKPLESGTLPLSITVTSAQLSTVRDFEIAVSPSGIDLVITTPTLGIGTISLPYQAELTAAGGEPPYVWRLVQGVLPTGLDLNSSGWLSGIPLVEGHYTVTLEVEDGLGARDIFEYNFRVQSANVTITTDFVPPATLGQTALALLEASGGREPYVWTAKSRLPPGMSLTEDGQLMGLPTQVGTHAFRVKVTDASEAGASDTGLFHLEVQPEGVFRIVDVPIPTILTREKLEYTLRAEGGTGTLTWSLEPGDSMPEGFELVPSQTAPQREIIVKGTSLYALTHGFGMRVKDDAGRVLKTALVIHVDPPEVRGPTEGCRCVVSSELSTPSAQGLWSLALLLGSLVFVRRRRSFAASPEES